jgi:uncharacterized protein (DUF1778 family)
MAQRCVLYFALRPPYGGYEQWSVAMPNVIERKDHPLSMRLPSADIAIIDRAASLRGRSRTDFVRDAAVREAENVVMEAMPIRMSAEGFSAFMEALAQPGRPVPEMVEVMRRSAPWETETDGD